MEKINKKFFEFVDKTPNAFYCVKNMKEELEQAGFEELFEDEMWCSLKSGGKYYVSRNDSSLIAFKMPIGIVDGIGFNITSAHADSPSFSIKPNADIYENGYLKLNIGGYGAMINYSWFDRALSLSGRVIVKKGIAYKKIIINIDKDLLFIPSQAIHINREVNSKNEPNHQIDMLPIMSSSNEIRIKDIIVEQLKEQCEDFDKLCDYDLYLYNRDKAKYSGLKNEFILSPRLDDLASLFPALCSFVDSENENSINVFCAFDNEEIGSLTQQGADSTFLIDVLTKITQSKGIDLLVALSNSIVVSVDNAHAIHPNAPSKSDPTNKVYLNGGVVIKHHTNYTTDALTSSIFKGICEEADVPYQDFACRADMKCGSTLGGISQRHVGVASLDIGIPQLAMHSANEQMGSADMMYMYQALLQFYNTQFIKERNAVKLISKNIK